MDKLPPHSFFYNVQYLHEFACHISGLAASGVVTTAEEAVGTETALVAAAAAALRSESVIGAKSGISRSSLSYPEATW